MAALQIRSVPEEVHEWLVQEAAEQHRSINQQALVFLKEYKRYQELSEARDRDGFEVIRPLRYEEPSQKERDERRARLRKQFEEMKEYHRSTGFVYPESMPSPAELIREDRDR